MRNSILKQACIDCKHCKIGIFKFLAKCRHPKWIQTDWVTKSKYQIDKHCSELNHDGNCQDWERKTNMIEPLEPWPRR